MKSEFRLKWMKWCGRADLGQCQCHFLDITLSKDRQGFSCSCRKYALDPVFCWKACREGSRP